MIKKIYIALFLPCFFLASAHAQELYVPGNGQSTKWISLENPTGEKGMAGLENKGAKGHAAEWVNAGQRKVMMDYDGAGIINRIWLTFIERSSKSLRSIYIEIYWDGAAKPAVPAVAYPGDGRLQL